jgi:hypothetical protein
MGCLAILSPFFAGPLALFLVGVLLITCGTLEMLETFQAADEFRRRSAYLSGALSILAVADCAYYPRKDFLIDKLDRETPASKRPLWLWVKHLRAWPLTAESLAGAFVYSRAPYLQSFVEIRVETSKEQVRLIPHAATGRLSWRGLETLGVVMPSDKTGADPVEFVVPMSRRQT